MKLMFATCDRQRALEFMEQAFAKPLKDEGLTAQVLDLVAADVIRVQDPMMHGRCGIIPSENWKEEDKASVIALLQKFQEATQ